MKTYLAKCRIILLAAIIIWCLIPVSVQAEDHSFHCYPSEEQIQAYKKDGTWEERQEYVKKLNYAAPSQELLYRAIQRESGIAGYAAGDRIPSDWKCMQITGNAKMLLVQVEFADVKFEDTSSGYRNIYPSDEFYNMIMGGTDRETFAPYESLNAYYARSSYNALNITSGPVYRCTLSQNREAYNGSDTGEQALIKEVLTKLDQEQNVDFAEYDANNDGRLDALCINFAGENSGWGSTWWSHKYDFLDNTTTFDDVRPAGYIFLETGEADNSYGTQVLIHETGHLLGLPDYYGQNSDGIGTTDMMNNNTGDHNGFSKWLLGWIEEQNIQRITSKDSAADVTLSPLACDVPGDNKLIAVIAPEDTSIYSEYFVVQYDKYMGNQSISDLKTSSGYRVLHVDAQLNNEGTNFLYNNLYDENHPLIRAVSIVDDETGGFRYYYKEGDALTPDTNESSAFYGGSIWGFTGMELTNFKTDITPSFHVAFQEKAVVDGQLELTIVDGTLLNTAAVTLSSNKPLFHTTFDVEAYLEDADGNQYPLQLLVNDGSQQIKASYASITNPLEPETEYTLVIPAKMFQIDKDVYSEECRLTVKTGNFPKLEADYTYGIELLTNLFPLGDTRSGFIRIIDSTDEYWLTKLHVFEGTKEVGVTDVNIPIPETYSNINDIQAVTLHDGTIAVGVRSSSPKNYRMTISSFYKIDQNGKVLAGPFSVSENLNIFPVGNILKGTVSVASGPAGAPDIDDEAKLKIYTIDFKNEPTSRLINMYKGLSKAFSLDEKSYLIIEESPQGSHGGIFNHNDDLLQTIDLSAHITGTVCDVVKAGDHLIIMHSTYLGNDEDAISVSEFDMQGRHLSTRQIIQFKDPDATTTPDAWELEQTSWGYGLSNAVSGIIYFLDDEFQLISSMQVPSGACSGTHMGSRYIVQWQDSGTWTNKVAITEPIISKKTEDATSSKSENPPNAIASKNHLFPNTGDDSRLLLLFFVLIISGGMIVRNIKRN